MAATRRCSILLGADAEKDPSLLANPANEEEEALFATIKRRLEKNPRTGIRKLKPTFKGVTEETTTGVLRLYQREKSRHAPLPGDQRQRLGHQVEIRQQIWL